VTARTAIATLTLAIGCAPPAAPLGPPARCAYVTAPRAAPDGAYHYRVSVSPHAEELCVEVDVPPSRASRWAPEGPLSPFVRDVAIADGDASSPIAAQGPVWPMPACDEDRGCRVRYRVMLGDAARRLDDLELAEVHRGAIFSPPSSWLMRPLATRAPFRADVTTPPGTDLVTGLARRSDGAYVGNVGELDDTPYAAFGALAQRTLTLPGGALQVALVPSAPARTASAAVGAWVERSARAIVSYFGRFPIPRAAILVKIEEGSGVGSGHTMGGGGATIVISAGEESTDAELTGDWILVHEMVHLSFPDVRTPWAEEGLATYLTPIVRARAGAAGPDEVWRGLIEGLPQGQPEAGDRGLDTTPSWARRYWGGAAFWLLADVEIRKRTEGRRSLDDALRAVSARGGNVSVRWDLEATLAIGDEAVGVPALRPLRARLGGRSERVDLDALWRALGVSIRDGEVRYDDDAPLAAIRRAMAAPRDAKSGPHTQ
jgi:hypothetical protein